MIYSEREREREREHNIRVGWLHKMFQSFKLFPQLVSFILIFIMDIIYKANSSSMKPMKLGIQKGVDDLL
jgi:hypothetical protein